ncbi:hypothetical protein THTE_3616 [Thermogutta terrifontis]|uniref:Uncharacterized protein n=1 Tax=Thermogutta terrifontis TaxID=1331910 RepID=A0A286RJS7_9BACT|nr:hypothetical protein THTE_3616 [Thermogutta terrifontis]
MASAIRFAATPPHTSRNMSAICIAIFPDPTENASRKSGQFPTWAAYRLLAASLSMIHSLSRIFATKNS